MKLNIECVRSVLIEPETLPPHVYIYSDFIESVRKHGDEEVNYCLAKLIEAQYVNGDYKRSGAGTILGCRVYDMTFSGHQFLDTIRDNKVWATLKSVGQSIPFNVILNIGQSLLIDALSTNLMKMK